MKNRNFVLSQGVLSAGLAGMCSYAVLAFAACRKPGPAASYLNAVSHWFRGNKAPHLPERVRTAPNSVMLGLYMAIALGLLAGAMGMRRNNRDEDTSADSEAAEPERRVVRRVRAGSI